MGDDHLEDLEAGMMRTRYRLEQQLQENQRRSERSAARLERLLDGPPAVEKHILLLRLTELVEAAPEFTNPLTRAQRRWLSGVRAVFAQLKDPMWRVRFDSSVDVVGGSPVNGANRIVGCADDVIATLSLELELDGRSEIGSVYQPGDVYRYFADVKEIIVGANSEILLVDPYFDGAVFDSYFGAVGRELRVRLLVDRYASDLQGYVERHVTSFGSRIELRRNQHELHDRLLFVDAETCWFTGSSFKDAGRKASYLIPLGSELAREKYSIYRAIWAKSSRLLSAGE